MEKKIRKQFISRWQKNTRKILNLLLILVKHYFWLTSNWFQSDYSRTNWIPLYGPLNTETPVASFMHIVIFLPISTQHQLVSRKTNLSEKINGYRPPRYFRVSKSRNWSVFFWSDGFESDNSEYSSVLIGNYSSYSRLFVLQTIRHPLDVCS